MNHKITKKNYQNHGYLGFSNIYPKNQKYSNNNNVYYSIDDDIDFENFYAKIIYSQSIVMILWIIGLEKLILMKNMKKTIFLKKKLII